MKIDYDNIFAQHQLRMSFLNLKMIKARMLLMQGLLPEHEKLQSEIVLQTNQETYVLFVCTLKDAA